MYEKCSVIFTREKFITFLVTNSVNWVIRIRILVAYWKVIIITLIR